MAVYLFFKLQTIAIINRGESAGVNVNERKLCSGIGVLGLQEQRPQIYITAMLAKRASHPPRGVVDESNLLFTQDAN